LISPYRIISATIIYIYFITFEQDYQYFPYKNDSLVAVFIHLDDTNMENGGLAVYPGSHKLGPLEDKGDISGRFHV
jgi:phytanoyl-CoA hydroxylase